MNLSANFGGAKVGAIGAVIVSAYVTYLALVPSELIVLVGQLASVLMGIVSLSILAVLTGQRKERSQTQAVKRDLKQQLQTQAATITAISQQLQQEITHRQQTEERLNSILGNLTDAVWSISAQTGGILYLNPAARSQIERLYGESAAKILDKPNLWLSAIAPQDRKRYKVTQRELRTKGSWDVEYRIVQPNGKVRWLRDRACLICDRDGTPLRIDGTIADITQHKQVEKQLAVETLYDSLTGLPNRDLFVECLEIALVGSRRKRDNLFALLTLDLNRFQTINDSLGHWIGDQLLLQVSDRLKDCIRGGDSAARIGSDRFALLLENIDGQTDAIQAAERLQTELSKPFQLGGQEVFVSARIGIVLSRKARTGRLYDSPDALLRDAIAAMQRAKQLGQWRCDICDLEPPANALGQLQLETELWRAIEKRDLQLFYQPIVALSTGAIQGFEALCRWHHPQRGWISPAEFIPLAEATGAIVPLGEWVLQEACEQMHRWQLQGLLGEETYVNVNLSGKQLARKDIVDLVAKVVARTGLEARRLRLEIVEDAICGSIGETLAKLQQLRSLGVQLAIDDFGVGCSSLSRLHRFPFNILKIDRSFINLLESGNREIVKTIIALGANLGMQVVAEGIETGDRVEQLQQLGCHFGQGYWFSRPVDSEAIAPLLRQAQTRSQAISTIRGNAHLSPGYN